MNKIAEFQKVSLDQFQSAWKNSFPEASEEEIKNIYEEISLPKRATTGSAGYDFYAPSDIHLNPGEELLLPTGIRAKMDEDYVLMVFPRSSLGFKFRLQLDNTVGIIDSDYYNAENEGHIMCKLINDSRNDKVVEVQKGAGIVQGIFLPYGITVDDEVEEKTVFSFS